MNFPAAPHLAPVARRVAACGPICGLQGGKWGMDTTRPIWERVGEIFSVPRAKQEKGVGSCPPPPRSLLPHAVADVLEGTLGVFANRMVGKLLFNLTVEHNITNHLLAADVDMTRDEYNELRSGSVHEVNSTRGAISLKDVIQEGND